MKLYFLGCCVLWLMRNPSPQNEPDYSAPTHATCLFGAQETFNIPGYFEAAREVYKEVHKAIQNPPAMIGPESFGMDQYIAEFPFGGGGMFAAVANHLYASGTAPDQSYDPYSFSPALVRAKQYALGKGIQTLWMSEYAKLSGFEYQDPLRLAIIMHNALTLADVSVYLHWDGAWGAPSNGPASEGSLILVENPFADRSTWQYPKGYKVLHTYWWIKHFTRFVRPTYRRVQCDIAGLNNVLISAWTGANGVFSIILINTGSVQAEVSIRQLPSWIAIQNTDRYYSTLDIGFTYAGRFYGDFISIPPLSITSLFSYAAA
jgi:glucuronoarabinoxylan endo-1,4-beta-xylanase